MSVRPRASLDRVLDDLGTTLLELGHGVTDHGEDIGGIVIHDPGDEAEYPRCALVLGVGLYDPDEIAKLLMELGRRNAAALIVRAPVPTSDTIVAAAEQSRVVVLGLTRGASWTQLAAMLRSLIAECDVRMVETECLGGIPSGDLFALANAVAALLNAPVTIEDRSSRVLAFSGRQDEADQSRIETILGRQVPERYVRIQAENGVFRELYRSDQPVWIEPLPSLPGERVLPRVAVAVRAGDEVLGSIWAAVGEPLSEERTQALCDAAKLVALHMLHIRAGADIERRLRADLLSTALDGGAGARQALGQLGLGDQAVVVLALAVPEPPGEAPSVDSDTRSTTERERLSDGFAMHLGAVHPRCAAALVGDVAYGLVPVAADTTDGEEHAMRIANEFLRRVGNGSRAVIGVGPIARDVPELAYSRSSVDRVLRVLRSDRGRSHRVARLADVHGQALVHELQDLMIARGDRPTGPIARLLAYDAEHHSSLVETLRAWLEALGDVTAASAAIHVHPNTFRYRLRRLAEVGEMDLNDPESRFTAMLQLRLLTGP